MNAGNPMSDNDGAYPPIEIDSERQIRVLKLLPSEDETSQICCEMFVVTLSSAQGLSQPADIDQSYDALSYAWGSKKAIIPISINHGLGRVNITLNLWLALWRLRQKRLPRALWIDQICIDQNDIRERNHQVRLMQTVYSDATRVLVWLGDDAHEVLGRAWQSTGSAFLSQYLQERQGRWRTVGVSPKVERGPEEYLNKVMKMASSSWWERIWIVQEVALARDDPLVLFGPHEVNWKWVTAVHQYESKRPLAVSARHFRNGDRSLHTAQNFTMVKQILWRTSSTDPRDKVYALLGLLGSVIQNIVQPDYTKSVEDVFAQATFASIVAGGTFELLAFIDQRDHPPTLHPPLDGHRLPNLPSWTYDFTMAKSLSDEDYPGIGEETLKETPNIVTLRSPESMPCVHYDQKNRALIIRGRVLDTISAARWDERASREDLYARIFAMDHNPHNPPQLASTQELALESLHNALDVTAQPNDIKNPESWMPASVGARPSLPVASAIEHILQSLTSNCFYTTKHADLEQHKTFQIALSEMLKSFQTTMDSTAFLTNLFQHWRSLVSTRPAPQVPITRWRFEKSHSTKNEVYIWQSFFGDQEIFLTLAGFMGIAPSRTRPGDGIFLPEGSYAPVILRLKNEKEGDVELPKTWEFGGFAFVNGVMRGELQTPGLMERVEAVDVVLI